MRISLMITYDVTVDLRKFLNPGQVGTFLITLQQSEKQLVFFQRPATYDKRQPQQPGAFYHLCISLTTTSDYTRMADNSELEHKVTLDCEASSPDINWDDDFMEDEGDVHEQLSRREAEVKKLETENQGLFAMLRFYTNLEKERAGEDKEALKEQVQVLQDSNTTLLLENSKLAAKNRELEENMRQMQEENINPLQERISHMEEEMAKLQAEKTQLTDQNEKNLSQIRSLEEKLAEESLINEQTLDSLDFLKRQISFRDQDICQLERSNQSLSAKLLDVKDQLLQTNGEIQQQEPSWTAERQTVPKHQKETDTLDADLQQTVQQLQANITELQEQQKQTQALNNDLQETVKLVRANNKALVTFCLKRKKRSLFERFRNARSTETQTDEEEEIKEPAVKKKKKKSFWSWFRRSDRKMEEANASTV